MRNEYRILVRKREGKGQLRGTRYKGQDCIKMDLRKIGFWGLDLFNLTQVKDRFQIFELTAMDLRFP
jgi:hypothetical protein